MLETDRTKFTKSKTSVQRQISAISQISQQNIKKPQDAKKIFDESIKKKVDSVLIQVFENNFSRFLILKLK